MIRTSPLVLRCTTTVLVSPQYDVHLVVAPQVDVQMAAGDFALAQGQQRSERPGRQGGSKHVRWRAVVRHHSWGAHPSAGSRYLLHIQVAQSS